jgi:hypothetical protein
LVQQVICLPALGGEVGLAIVSIVDVFAVRKIGDAAAATKIKDIVTTADRGCGNGRRLAANGFRKDGDAHSSVKDLKEHAIEMAAV